MTRDELLDHAGKWSSAAGGFRQVFDILKNPHTKGPVSTGGLIELERRFSALRLATAIATHIMLDANLHFDASPLIRVETDAGVLLELLELEAKSGPNVAIDVRRIEARMSIETYASQASRAMQATARAAHKPKGPPKSPTEARGDLLYTTALDLTLTMDQVENAVNAECKAWGIRAIPKGKAGEYLTRHCKKHGLERPKRKGEA
jgi:hypothetical protein